MHVARASPINSKHISFADGHSELHATRDILQQHNRAKPLTCGHLAAFFIKWCMDSYHLLTSDSLLK
jgi:hypothetical protein